MAGRITRQRIGGNSSSADAQSVSADLAPRHFLTFHNSVSRLQRIKFQLSVNASLESYDDDDNENYSYPPQEENIISDANNNSKNNFSFSSSVIRPQLCGSDNCEIRMITDPAHPAFRQCGLFSTQKIAANALIMPYAGLVTLVGTIPSSQTYIMSYGGEDSDLGIDAEYFGNFARFANDPRGTGLASNAFAVMKPTRLGETFTALVAKRQILDGEEILLDYGKRHRLSKVPLISRKGTLLTHARPALAFRQRQQQDENANASNTRDTSNVFALMTEQQQQQQRQEKEDSGIGSRCVWQCFQCGVWNDGGDLKEAPWTIAMCCATCSQPRASDTTPYVAVFDVVKELQQNKQQQDRVRQRNENDGDDDDDEEEENENANETRKEIMNPFATPIPQNGVLSPTFTIQRHCVMDDFKGQPRNLEATAIMSREECSVAASWPLHFPFVSWQVWDPEVSNFAVNGNAKQFVQQSGIAVAEVDDGEGENLNGKKQKKDVIVISTDDDDDDDDDGQEKVVNNLNVSIKGIFCCSGAKQGEEIGIVGGLLVDKNWSCSGQDLRQKYLGFSGDSKKTIFGQDDDDDEEEEEEQTAEEKEEKDAKKDNDDDDDDDDDRKSSTSSSDEDDTDDDQDTESDEDFPLSSLLSNTASFVAPFFIINLRHLRVTHRPFVHLPAGEMDVVPQVKLPQPPNSKSYLGEKFLDLFFYPTNEAQHLRVANPERRQEKIMQEQNSSSTRCVLPHEAFEYVPSTSIVNAPPNATLELVRDPVGFIYVAIVAVDEANIPRWAEIVI